jgi:cell division protein FtsZ
MIAANAAISSPLLEDASVKGARGVIINVTGGHDLSLIEVSEASAVIQEAAHEEANIIFGAVVDPRMDGQVKITVIATGFDRAPAQRDVSASAQPTPVDLNTYAAWQQDKVAVSGGGGGSRNPVAINRRSVLNLPLAQAVNGSNPGAGAAESEFDSSPLDVPAFLRRQSE